MKIEIIDHNSPHLDEVKRLGKENAATLGFFPEGAFDDYALKRQILGAIDEEKGCVGYLLYRVSNRTVKLVHLCVSNSFRGQGFHRGLVDRLKAETNTLDGISLRCRRDYSANKIWPTLGFLPVGELRGRSFKGSILVQWWFDHGHPTLFDLRGGSESESRIEIVIDANVFYDLYDESRNGFVESNSLRADWLDESLTINVVDELFQEIHRCEDEEDRTKSLSRIADFSRLKYERDCIETVFQELKTMVCEKKPVLNQRDISDFRQVASAICGHASYFVTRDEFLLGADLATSIKESFGLHILRPLDLIKQIDELRRERDYQPANLRGSDLRRQLIRAREESEVTRVFHQRESRTSFQNRFRGFLADITNFHCYVIRDKDQNLLSLFVTDQSTSGTMSVPILRIQPGKIAPTLIRHIILQLINESIRLGNDRIEIQDEKIDSETRVALLEEKFVESGDNWGKFHVRKILTKSAFANLLKTLNAKTETERAMLDGTIKILNEDNFQLTPSLFADIEKLFYPIKISDSLLPSFLVPIRPNWAKELFDTRLAEQGLFSTKDELAIRKEQVYYRSPLNSAGLRSPARILWYVSRGGSKEANIGSVRAVSLVDQVDVGKPKELFAKYKRLGIYEWKNIYELVKQNIDNDVMAIRFTQTELFEHPIDLATLRQIMDNHHSGLQLQSVSRISQNIFIDVYRKGMNL